jgi:hypothetical protein
VNHVNLCLSCIVCLSVFCFCICFILLLRGPVFLTEKTSTYEGGDVYLASSSTRANNELWLVNSSASFNMTPHREWFCKYEMYDGGDVFLGDESKTKIIG